MSDITDIESLVRYQIGDYSKSLVPGDVFVYQASAIFTLSEANVNSVTAVIVNGVTLSESDYSFDSSTNKVTITASLTLGDIIEIQYTYYPKFSSNQIENFIRAAVVHLSVNNYYTFEVDDSDNMYPTIRENEKNLISFIASILISPENKSYRLPDITVNVPKSLPTRDLISKAISVFKHNTHGVFSL